MRRKWSSSSDFGCLGGATLERDISLATESRFNGRSFLGALVLPRGDFGGTAPFDTERSTSGCLSLIETPGSGPQFLTGLKRVDLGGNAGLPAALLWSGRSAEPRLLPLGWRQFSDQFTIELSVQGEQLGF